MAYYLNCDSVDDYVTASWTPATTFSLEVDLETPATIPDDVAIIEIYDAGFDEKLGIRNTAGAWKISTNGKTPGTGSAIPPSTRLTVKLDWDGAQFILYVDGVENYRVTPTSSGFLSNLNSLILNKGGAPGLTASFGMKLYLATVVRNGTNAYKFDPSASGGTGSTLPDTVGTNNGTLVNFPVDNSQWVPDGPNVIVDQTALTPGGIISGTYNTYATIPTTLTVSDGTNTITIPTPSIDDTAKTFSGTMPALPTTGTANLVLFGNVTVSLT